jgi:hypothetical protein
MQRQAVAGFAGSLLRKPLGTAVLAAACGWASPALAADRWEPVAGEAAITLPDPLQAKGIAGASLACAEQKWTLSLTPAPDATVRPGEMAARLFVGAQMFEVAAMAADGKLFVPVVSLAIAPMKAGTRAKITIGDAEPALEATFPLRGSKVAIETAEPFCSKRDMSGYERIGLTPYSSYLLEAKELRKDEIRLFRQATSSEPVVSATKSVMQDGRSLLFVELCGSTWYYGASGCNAAVFARLSDAAEWKQVYDAEGADFYLDTGALVDGWPNLITLPKKGGGDEVLWAWSDDGYAVTEGGAMASGPEGASAQDEQ